MYDRSSLLAKLGAWECDLATNALIWTDGVYDLFELPRGSVIDREQTAALYEPESCREMERLRAQAIATGSSFTLDAQIRTARGNLRWMRLTADVECENGIPVRLFGAKQDITAEKAVWHRMEALAAPQPDGRGAPGGSQQAGT
jgi:PAS domain-containing protein